MPRRSPSRGILREDYRPAQHAKAYAEAGAAAISVLTEPTFFDGSLEHLREVREAVDLPLLRKDFIVERYQIFEAVASGADAILLIVGALTPVALKTLLVDAAIARVAALVEVHDAEELRAAVGAGAEVIGVNSRNLRTLGVEPRLHDELAPLLPKRGVTVAESGLRERRSPAARTRRLPRVPGRRAADAAGSVRRSGRFGSPRMIRVKICGVTTPRTAARRGAGALRSGWCSGRTVRASSTQAGAGDHRGLPPFVAVVGVFVDQVEEALSVAREIGLSAVQFHGDEPPESYRDFPRG